MTMWIAPGNAPLPEIGQISRVSMQKYKMSSCSRSSKTSWPVMVERNYWRGVGQFPRRRSRPGCATTACKASTSCAPRAVRTVCSKQQVLSHHDGEQLSSREVAARYDICNQSQMVVWRRDLDDGGVQTLESRQQRYPILQPRVHQARIARTQSRGVPAEKGRLPAGATTV